MSYPMDAHKRPALGCANGIRKARNRPALAHLDDNYIFRRVLREMQAPGALIALVKLRARLSNDYPLKDVRVRLRCQRCRSRHIVIRS